MTDQLSTITLSIRDKGTPGQPAFIFNLMLDGKVIESDQSLSPDQSQSVRDFSRAYGNLFEHRFAPGVASDNLKVLGAQLFDLWLARAWDRLKTGIPSGAKRSLIIASDAPDALNLPWELMRPPGNDFIAFDPKYSIRRLPSTDPTLAPFAGRLPPRPLRILFMACSPQDLASLDFEREEESLIRAIASAGPDVTFDSGDLGSFEEL
ncbi:MAG: hypothetical protein L0229_24890 [Blastocatellia bacterium]|nr:hypothetical protein [Blastocatellia bacterium]